MTTISRKWTCLLIYTFLMSLALGCSMLSGDDDDFALEEVIEDDDDGYEIPASENYSDETLDTEEPVYTDLDNNFPAFDPESLAGLVGTDDVNVVTNPEFLQDMDQNVADYEDQSAEMPEFQAKEVSKTAPIMMSSPSMQSTTSIPSAPRTFSIDPTAARVYYLMETAALLDNPDSATVVANLVQGDLVLATIDGEWAQVLNRGWVRTSQLTEEPVGRIKTSQVWQ